MPKLKSIKDNFVIFYGIIELDNKVITYKKGMLLVEKFLINYHTGITEQVKVHDLDKAKEIAKEGIAYTQENITIETLDGEVVTTSYWYGVQPQEDDEVLEIVGSGFYQVWSDELGE